MKKINKQALNKVEYKETEGREKSPCYSVILKSAGCQSNGQQRMWQVHRKLDH